MKFTYIHKAILDSMGEGVYVVDPEMVILYANPASVKLTGYTSGEAIGRLCHQIFCEQSDLCNDVCPPKLAMRENIPILHKEAETRTKNGEIKLTQISFSPFYKAEGEACKGAVIVINDITDLRKAEEKIRQQNIFLKTIIDAIPNPFYVIDTDNYHVIMANKAACPPGRVEEGTTCYALTHNSALPCSSEDHSCPIHEVMQTGKPTTIEHRHYQSDGKWHDVEIHAFPVFDSDNKIVRIIEYNVDISERKLVEKRLHELAYYDQMTGVPNRTLLNDRINHAMVSAKRENGNLALLYMDLYRFKSINDQFGHEAGDFLLKEAAQRIHACLRESDTVARIGGDEFAALLPDITCKHDAIAIAERIIYALAQPFQCADNECTTGASIGISLYPDDGDTCEDLLKKADAAMYMAKDEGANYYRFWGEERSHFVEIKKELS